MCSPKENGVLHENSVPSPLIVFVLAMVVMVMFAVVIATAEPYIAFDAIFDDVFKAVQQHFSADDGSCATKRPYRHFASASLQESGYAALLSLCRYVDRSRHDSCQVGMATGTIWRSHWRHSHACWAV